MRESLFSVCCPLLGRGKSLFKRTDHILRFNTSNTNILFLVGEYPSECECCINILLYTFHVGSTSSENYLSHHPIFVIFQYSKNKQTNKQKTKHNNFCNLSVFKKQQQQTNKTKQKQQKHFRTRPLSFVICMNDTHKSLTSIQSILKQC